MMKHALHLWPLMLLLTACGEPARCECTLSSASSPVTFLCGQTTCIDGHGWRCVGDAQATAAPDACGTTLTTCTPTTCAAKGAQCGSIPDGCGGALQCGSCGATESCTAQNACESLCANKNCGAGQRCEPTTGQCVADACTAAGAVCGTVSGVTCGTCPSGSTCASTQKACVEKVATLPFVDYTLRAAHSGDLLYVTGPKTKNATKYSLVEVSLSTKQVRSVVDDVERLGPLSHNGAHLYFTNATGLNRVAPGSLQVDAIPAFTGGCSQLLATSTQVLCGIGGDARYGVGSFGIKSAPLAGGTSTWVKSYLNYPHMSIYGTLLFYVGTTDNMYSFSNLGVKDFSDGFEQVLVSGGAMDSKFVLNDAAGYYFVRKDTNERVLVRTGYADANGTDLAKGSGFFQGSTRTTGSEVFTIATIGSVAGLYRIPVAPIGKPELLLGKTEAGADLSNTEHLFLKGKEQLLVVGVDVYRVFTP